MPVCTSLHCLVIPAGSSSQKPGTIIERTAAALDILEPHTLRHRGRRLVFRGGIRAASLRSHWNVLNCISGGTITAVTQGARVALRVQLSYRTLALQWTLMGIPISVCFALLSSSWIPGVSMLTLLSLAIGALRLLTPIRLEQHLLRWIVPRSPHMSMPHREGDG
jgi:hypothetical protein